MSNQVGKLLLQQPFHLHFTTFGKHPAAQQVGVYIRKHGNGAVGCIVIAHFMVHQPHVVALFGNLLQDMQRNHGFTFGGTSRQGIDLARKEAPARKLVELRKARRDGAAIQSQCPVLAEILEVGFYYLGQRTRLVTRVGVVANFIHSGMQCAQDGGDGRAHIGKRKLNGIEMLGKSEPDVAVFYQQRILRNLETNPLPW